MNAEGKINILLGPKRMEDEYGGPMADYEGSIVDREFAAVVRRLRLEDDDLVPNFEATLVAEDFEAVVRRLQHAFIKWFQFDISENAFLSCWREKQRQDLDFTVERIQFEGKYADKYMII